jgi:hypothetical protein
MARAKGEVPTGAKFIREYIINHPLYKNDSKISKCLQCCLINQITNLNKDQSNICDCQATDNESHDSDCCDKTINFMKNKGASKSKKSKNNNTLFDISDVTSSNEDDLENKLNKDSLD